MLIYCNRSIHEYMSLFVVGGKDDAEKVKNPHTHDIVICKLHSTY